MFDLKNENISWKLILFVVHPKEIKTPAFKNLKKIHATIVTGKKSKF